jgi:haloalkane dehalogenase
MTAHAPSPPRPDWVPEDLYPFESRYAHVAGARVHYVDEGSGPPLRLLHGNPTWSFLYRDVIAGLRDRFRCIAPDLPGFGLSRAPTTGYGFTPAEHTEVIERVVQQLDLCEITLMVQDWGGPIGFALAGRMPERFARYVIGNTWAWSMKGNRGAEVFSAFLGGPVGRYLITRRNFFVETIVPRATRADLSERVMDMYRGPFRTPESRRPVAVLPKEIMAASSWLEGVERAIPQRPALIVWPTDDQAFRDGERRRWERLLDEHETVLLEGERHYIGEDAPDEIVAAVRDWGLRPEQDRA